MNLNSKKPNNGKKPGSSTPKSSFYSRTDTILVNDHPMSMLSFEGVDGNGLPIDYAGLMKDGQIISELGSPTQVTAGGNKVTAFMMRKQKKVKLPTHIFGKMHLQDAFATWTIAREAIPAVTADPLILTAQFSPMQDHLARMYKGYRYDSIYLITILEPLGANHLLEASLIEGNTGNVLRTIRWRPHTCETMAFYVPFSFTSPVLTRTLKPAELAQVGSQSIKITTIADNTSESVSKPVMMTIWSCVTNVHCVGLSNAPFEDIVIPPTPEHTPPPPPAETIRYVTLHADEGDVVAEADVSSADAQSVVGPQPGDELAEAAPQTILPPTTTPKPATPGNTLGAQSGKWQLWKKLTLADSDVGKPINLSFKPTDLERGKGETMMRPFRSNVYFTFPQTNGWAAGFNFKLVSTRTSYFAGLIKITLGGGDTMPYPYVIHKIGGAATEFELISRKHRVDTLLRHVNSPFLYTKSENAVEGSIELIQFNRTDEKADFQIQLFVRPGKLTFQVPVKPRPKPKAPATRLVKSAEQLSAGDILAMINTARKVQLHSDEIDPDSFVTAGTDRPEHGLIDMEGESEELAQDSMELLVGTYHVSKDKPLVLPLNLQNIADKAAPAGSSAIAEKFARFANIVPTGVCDFGPAIGEYRIVAHLPSDRSAILAHNCLPSDLNDEVAIRLFGLDTLLSIAGTAVTSVGGALVNGAVNAVGGLANAVGINIPGASKAPPPSNNLGGKIPFSRFFEFFKSVIGKEGSQIVDNALKMGTLVIEVLELIDNISTRSSGEIPVSIYVRLSADPETEIYERSDVVDVESPAEGEVYLTPSQQLNVAEVLTLAGKEEDALRILSHFDMESTHLLSRLRAEEPSKAKLNALLTKLHTLEH